MLTTFVLVLWQQLASQIPSRHRAVRPPSAPCSLPTLVLTLSKNPACSGDAVTLSWHASDPNSLVSVVGIGSSLPATGAQPIDASNALTYYGYARNSCGSGEAAVAELKLLPPGAASLSASPSSIQQGQTATLTVSVADVKGWTLSSALGNGLSQASGTSSAFVTYTGTHAGSDTVTLTAHGNCLLLQPSQPIFVAPPSMPPPSSGTLRCCDGTLSPTCTSCANKQGCCSGHKGVCGC